MIKQSDLFSEENECNNPFYNFDSNSKYLTKARDILLESLSEEDKRLIKELDEQIINVKNQRINQPANGGVKCYFNTIHKRSDFFFNLCSISTQVKRVQSDRKANKRKQNTQAGHYPGNLIQKKHLIMTFQSLFIKVIFNV